MLKLDLAGFIPGNQVIRLQSAKGGKIEPKYVYIRLEMFSSTYLLVKSLKMDIFRQQIT